METLFKLEVRLEEKPVSLRVRVILKVLGVRLEMVGAKVGGELPKDGIQLSDVKYQGESIHFDQNSRMIRTDRESRGQGD